ncbi:MAG: nucleotide disphospho-sugar-binding domain-containing protein [bacterium]
MSGHEVICFLTKNGTAGDVWPLLRLAVGLKQAGFRIYFLADQGYRESARRIGITEDEWFCPGDIPLSIFLRTESAQRWLWGKAPRVSDLIFARKLHKNQSEKIEAFLEHLEAWNNSRIIASIASISAWSMLHRFGPGCAKIISCPAPFQPSRSFSLAPPGIFWQTQVGMWFFRNVRQRRITGNTKEKYEKFMQKSYHLVSVSPEFFPRPKDWLPNMQVTGYIPFQDMENWQPPDSLIRFLEGKDAPVYVGFGSLPFLAGPRGKKLAGEIIKAFSILGLRCIIQSSDLSDFPHPPNIYIMDYAAPHHWLFPRCAVIVHNGGYGTTHACLSAGKPMVIYPFQGDQFLWAKKAAEFGIGPHGVIRIRKLDRKRLITDILFTLEPDRQKAAQKFSAAIREEDGFPVQMSAIESIILHHQRNLSPLEWNMP